MKGPKFQIMGDCRECDHLYYQDHKCNDNETRSFPFCKLVQNRSSLSRVHDFTTGELYPIPYYECPFKKENLRAKLIETLAYIDSLRVVLKSLGYSNFEIKEKTINIIENSISNKDLNELTSILSKYKLSSIESTEDGKIKIRFILKVLI